MSKKIAVLFPGVRYSVDCPLLYFPSIVYAEQGYEIVEIKDYMVTGHKDGLNQLEQYAKEATDSVVNQLETTNWNQEDRIVFLEKSVGTVVGMRVEDELVQHGFEGKIHHVVLTPIRETLPYMTKGRLIDYMVSGELDNFIQQRELQEVCRKNGFTYELIPGVGHRLQVAGDVQKSLSILSRIVSDMKP